MRLAFPLGWLSFALPVSATELTTEEIRTFDAFFVEEYPRMVALAAAVSGDRSHAEDIAQEALRRASQRWTALSGYDKPGAWVRRVTVNLSISRKRRVVAEAKALLRLGPTEDSLGDPPPDHRRVWEAVAELSPKQRSVVSLHYLEDMALNEIARVLDMAESTVRVHLHRARARLAELLGGPFAVGES